MKSIHGSNGLPIIGGFLKYRQDRIQFLSNQISQYGDLSFFKLGSRKVILVTHPEDVQWVLQKNAKNYHKATNLGEVLGKGILTSEDELWKRQRRTIAPLFHQDHIFGLVPVMNLQIKQTLDSLASTLASKLGSAVEATQPIQANLVLMKMAYQVMGATLFGSNLNPYFEELFHSMNYLNQFLTKKLFRLIPIPDWVPLSSQVQFKKSMTALDRIVYQVIDEKCEQIRKNESSKDLVSLLIQAKDPETGQTMDRTQIRDEAITLMLAGHETTGHTLTWVAHYLSLYPDVQNECFEEINQKVQGEEAALEDVFKLEKISAVIDETLRIRPPVWAFTRRSIASDELRGHSIPAGSILFMTPYFTHRHADFWTKAEDFDPSRLFGEHKGQYFPFGLGPRQCVGKHFALLEVKLALVQILKKFKLVALSDAKDVKPDPMITMGIKNGLKMKWVRRS
jgi:cytochrome P450